MDIHSYIEKLRAMSDKQKKIVLWTIVIILAIGLGILWFKITISRFDKIEKSIKKIDIPSVETK